MKYTKQQQCSVNAGMTLCVECAEGGMATNHAEVWE